MSDNVPVTQADRDCAMLDALDFQVGAKAKVVGTYADEWPEPVVISGIENYRGNLNITICSLEGGDPTDGFSIHEISPLPRHRTSQQSVPNSVVEAERIFMDIVWKALKSDANDLRKQQRILEAYRALSQQSGQTEAELLREAREALIEPDMPIEDGQFYDLIERIDTHLKGEAQ